MREGLAEGRSRFARSHTCAEPLAQPATKDLPSGLKAPPSTVPDCGMGWPRGVPVNASQSRTVRSSPPVMIVLPSGLNATTLTWPSCWSAGPMGFPVTVSQSRAVLSSLAGEEPRAVGANGHSHDPRLDECMIGPMISPVVASQRFAVPPLTCPLKIDLPSGLKATAVAHVLTIENQPEGLAGVGIPEPHRVVATGGEKGLAVGAEGHGHDRALMHQGWSDGLVGHRVPEPRRLVLAPGQYGPAIGAEGHGPDFQSMPDGLADGFPGRRVPPLHRAVTAPGEMDLPSGLNATRRPHLPMLEAASRWAAGGGVPEPRRRPSSR